jgi:hypothetical protein
MPTNASAEERGNPPTASASAPPAPTRTSRVRDWLPLVMSILAFTVSVTSLYYAALRSGEVAALSGPLVVLGHDPLTGAANVSIAVNLSNVGARLITTRQLQLVVVTPDGASTVTLPAVAQQKFNAEGEPHDDALVAPITLAPRSETTRQLRFTTLPADVERFDFFQPGTYRFALLLSVASRPTPAEAERWTVTLTALDANQLHTWSDLSAARTLAVLKD